MIRQELDVLVVGAGAAGLGAALALEARGREVLVVDAAPAVGGVLRSERQGDFLFERGPNTIRVTAPALDLLQKAGAEAALLRARPESRRRFLLRGGHLVPVPMDPLAFARTPLLTPRGKLRLLAEPLVRRGDAAGETVADFVGRRLGPEVACALVGPFLVGVYAGDERRLGAEAVFPSLVAMEREGGSLARGGLARALRRGPRGLPGTWSARGGLGELAALLARTLRQPPRLSTRVAGLQPEPPGWRVVLAGPEAETEVRARAVVLATPAPEAATLLHAVDPEAAGVAAGVAYAPLASVSLSVDPAAARERIEGFGFLVPRDEKLDLLGALFMSRLFARRAPADRELVTAMVGGVRWPGVADASDDAILERVAAGLDRALGLRHGLEALAVVRWPRAVPQPDVQHPRRIASLRERLTRLPPLAVAGSWLDGVGVADTLACGARAGADVAARADGGTASA